MRHADSAANQDGIYKIVSFHNKQKGVCHGGLKPVTPLVRQVAPCGIYKMPLFNGARFSM